MPQLVYISEYLNKTNRGEGVVKALKNYLGSRLKEIPLNKNEWCRDYMPVKASDGSLVLFNYMPSYLLGRPTYEATIPEQEMICNALELNFETSNIILDGGAIEIFGKKGIISDRVISDNCSLWENGTPVILKEIKKLLKLETLIVIPSDPWDFTGHVDGLVRFIDGNRVLVNDLKGMEEKMQDQSKYEQDVFNRWKYNFYLTLDNARLNPKHLTCEVHRNEKDDDATGIYLNFLHLDDKILMPAYTNLPDHNKNAKKELERIFTNKEVIPIIADEIAKKGGVINCITWTN
jgi:agmatine deiminase